MRQQFFDRLTFEDDAKVRYTSDGYMVAQVRAARIGLQTYAGHEVGKPAIDKVVVLRPEDEVFKEDAMASFSSLPVTVNHPPEVVNASNWKKYASGFTGEKVARDGGFISVPLILKDEDAITTVRRGKRELSMGYTCDLDWTAGVTADGQKYDAVQRDLRGNHLAIVSAGRAGSECRVGDQADDHGGRQMTGPTLRTVIVDGYPISDVSDAAATVIETLQRKLKDAQTVSDAATATANATISARDKELGTANATIADLKKKVEDATLDASKLDALAQDRAEVIAKARAIVADFDPKGLSNDDIRKKVVIAKMGDASVKDRSVDYIAASFDHITASVDTFGGGDPNLVRDAIRFAQPTGTVIQDCEKNWQDHNKWITEAWKNGADDKTAGKGA
jgi:hypothetical protein